MTSLNVRNVYGVTEVSSAPPVYHFVSIVACGAFTLKGHGCKRISPILFQTVQFKCWQHKNDDSDTTTA